MTHGEHGADTMQVCKAAKDAEDAVAPEGSRRVAEARIHMGMRQRSWIGRHKGTNCLSWRPPQFHRMGARNWLHNLDNAFRVSTRKGGLAFFDPVGYKSAPWLIRLAHLSFLSCRHGLWQRWVGVEYRKHAPKLGDSLIVDLLELLQMRLCMRLLCIVELSCKFRQH